MKIITKTNLLQQSNDFSTNAQKRKFSEISKPHKNGYVSLNISSQGKNAFRNHDVTGNSNKVIDVDALRENLSKGVMHASDGVRADFHKRLLQKNHSLNQREVNEKGLTKNILSVYASMYDEIKQGYESGTREKRILGGDGSVGNEYRLLTEEEEIAALDEAFDFYSYVAEGYINYGIQAGKDVRQAIERTWGEQNEASEAEEKKEGKDHTLQLMRKLKKIRDNMKTQYINNGRQSMSMIFMQNMKNTIFGEMGGRA